jgi:hypothetical protein
MQKAPSWFKLLLNLKDIEVLLLAYPYACRPNENISRAIELELIKRISKKCLSIVYVVDLPIDKNTAFGDPEAIDNLCHRVERELFENMDKIIVFNERMKKRIQFCYGIEEERFILAEILDYGVRQPDFNKKDYSTPYSLVYAGNLDKRFLSHGVGSLPIGDNLEYHFFGLDGEWINGSGREFIYHGYKDEPFDVLSAMSRSAHYGLIMRDFNNPKVSEYCNYSTTSKFSAYMVSGLPVIVHQEYEYVSELALKYKVGLVVKKPQDIPDLISSISLKEYESMRKDAYELGTKISNGHFFKKSIEIATAT